MNNDIMFRIKVGKICREILHDKGKSKKVVMAEFLNRKKEMTDVINFPKPKFIDYPVEQELFERMLSLIHEYDGDFSIASAVGVIELVKDEIIKQHE